MPEVMNRELITVDYPEADERIGSSHYTIRLGLHADANRVEVSIDDSDWQPCRQAVGYWWYDWSGYQPGSHEIVARVHLRDGHTFTTSPRQVRVEFRTEKDISQKTNGSLRETNGRRR